MKTISLLTVTAFLWAVAGPAFSQQAPREQGRRPALPAPDHADVSYGPHERNVLDLWLAESDRPTPLVVFIHGGGFMGGDKSRIGGVVGVYRSLGWSVASVNYRLTNVAPAPAAYLDCGRAIQFLRSRAKEWNLDKELVASTGGSAGAGTSLWLAFHDDLADPASEDPVARESTRLTCVAVDSAQCSYDPRFVEAFGVPRPNLELHGFFFPFYGIERGEVDSPRAHRLYEEMAAITHLTRDDPPALLSYGLPDKDADARTELNLVVHHPRFGIKLKEKMDALGIACVVQYRGETGGLVRHGGGEPVRAADFIREQFERARQAGR